MATKQTQSDDDILASSQPHPAKRQKTFGHEVRDALDYGFYTIAWVCALAIERAAACAMLDEVHEELPRLAGDDNSYTLGKVAQHNVVIACLPESRMGKVHAATVLTNLMRTFPNVSQGLMVGIGGGAPSKVDLRLGDVVVGTRVMQYDVGKTRPNGETERTAVWILPQQSLGTAAATLRSKHELNSSRMPLILQQHMDTHGAFHRPKMPDRLFRATFEHNPLHSTCDECDSEYLVPRTARMSDTPIVWYGGIASGDQVVRDGVRRDIIARELDILCYEMEAAGLMGIMPCLPIRGICDYSDSHKVKDWQRYAASTAAAYARELLEILQVPTNVVPTTPAVGSTKQQQAPGTTQDQQPPDRRQTLTEAINFDYVDLRKQDIKREHHKTCRWFLSLPQFKEWLSPTSRNHHNGFLWIKGKPGTGESTIMKFIYKHVRGKRCGTSSATISFFFHARGELLGRTVAGAYRSLLLQLIEGFPDTQEVLDDTDLVPPSQTECPSLNVLKDLLHDAVMKIGSARSLACFVDALDECDEQQVMDMVHYFESLADECSEAGVNIRICFSSRHYPYIRVKNGVQLVLENQEGHVDDLINYTQSRLRIRDPSIVEELQEEIIRKAGGVFLWVVLVVDILNDEESNGRLALRRRLSRVPSKLSELFKDILTRDTRDMYRLLLCVLWILLAKRPLSSPEYHHALWAGLRHKDPNLVDTNPPVVSEKDDRDTLDSFVVTSSKGLAETSKAKEPTVQFIHESVRDFLIKDRGLHELWPELGLAWESEGHDVLKRSCNEYLDFIHAGLAEDQVTVVDTIVGKHAFSRYACQHVLYHANIAASTIAQDRFLHDFHLYRWMQVHNSFEKFKVRKYAGNEAALYLLAEQGHAELVRARLRYQPSIEFAGGRYNHPFFAAWASGSKDTVAAILELPSSIVDGVDLCDDLSRKKTSGGFENRSPLTWAIENGRLNVARALIARGVSVNGHLDEDRALKGADPNGSLDTKSNVSSTTPPLLAVIEGLLFPLATTSEEPVPDGFVVEDDRNVPGLETIVDFISVLIEAGAEVNCYDRDGLTPIHLAILYLSHPLFVLVLDLLLEHGANINIRGGRAYQTPLSWLIDAGGVQDVEETRRCEFARTLVEKGADAFAMDSEGATPFLQVTYMLWANPCWVDLMISMLERAPVVSAGETNVGHTTSDPLLNVIERTESTDQCIKIIKEMFKHRVDIHCQRGCGMTPIMAAVCTRRSEIVKLLLELGAKPYWTQMESNPSQRTPFHPQAHMLARRRVHTVLDLLLSRVADLCSSIKDFTMRMRPVSSNKLKIEMNCRIFHRQLSFFLLYPTDTSHEQYLFWINFLRLYQRGTFTYLRDPIYEAAFIFAGHQCQMALPDALASGIRLRWSTTISSWPRDTWKDIVTLLMVDNDEVEDPSVRFGLTTPGGDLDDFLDELFCIEKNTTKPKVGWTALHTACDQGSKDIALLLVDYGEDLNAISRFGLTPLHLAVLRRHQDLAEALIDKGADLHIPIPRLGHKPEYAEIAPLELAKRSGDNVVADYIQQALQRRN